MFTFVFEACTDGDKLPLKGCVCAIVLEVSTKSEVIVNLLRMTICIVGFLTRILVCGFGIAWHELMEPIQTLVPGLRGVVGRMKAVVCIRNCLIYIYILSRRPLRPSCRGLAAILRAQKISSDRCARMDGLRRCHSEDLSGLRTRFSPIATTFQRLIILPTPCWSDRIPSGQTWAQVGGARPAAKHMWICPDTGLSDKDLAPRTRSHLPPTHDLQ